MTAPRLRIALYLLAGLCGVWVLLRASRPDVDAVVLQREITAHLAARHAWQRQRDSLAHAADSLTHYVTTIEQRNALLKDRAASLNSDVRAAKAALAAAGTVADSLQRALGVIVVQDSVIGVQGARLTLDSTALAASARLAGILRAARDSAEGRAAHADSLLARVPKTKRHLPSTILFVGGVVVGHLLLH